MTFGELSDLLAERVEEVASALLPSGRREGHRWEVGNIHGDKGQSLKVDLSGPRKGRWKDFSTGEGGDMLDLVRAVKGCETKEAADWARSFLGLPAWEGNREQAPFDPSKFGFKRRGETEWRYPGASWTYRDEQGAAIAWVARFDHPDGKKDVMPIRVIDGKPRWKGWSDGEKRPLYNLHRLHSRPDAPVLVVEGEKTADAAARLFPDHVVVTWPGGTSAVNLADWRPLEGRCVICWPDADAPGMEAMRYVGTLLDSIAVDTRALPDKWDLADPAPDGVDPKALLAKAWKDGATDFTDPAPGATALPLPHSDGQFWDWHGQKNPVPVLSPMKFRGWLNSEGYARHYMALGGAASFIRMEAKMVEVVHPERIKDHTIRHLQGVGDTRVFDAITGKAANFKPEFLNMLPPIAPVFVRDSKPVSWMFYRNTAIRITADGIIPVSHADLPANIWRSELIDRDWTPSDTPIKGPWPRFMELISAHDTVKEDSIRSAVGYLLHRYKTKATARAVIINDTVISDDPQGGSGKGLLCDAIATLRSRVVIDGKRYRTDRQFTFAGITPDTMVMQIDDPPKNFRFEDFFSTITEGMVTEQKYKDPIHLSTEDSPKVVFTTNYVIPGTGSSFDRRRFDIEIANYFSAMHRPVDEFGHHFFEEWNMAQWQAFDIYMVGSLQLYLRNGLVQAPFTNLRAKRLIQASCMEFRDFCEDGRLPYGKWLYTGRIMDDFMRENLDYSATGKYRLSAKRWNHWLKAWADYNGWTMRTGKDANGRRVFFHSDPVDGQVAEIEQNTIIDNTDTDCPF